ncbi:MAG: SDR family oxidoreductase [Verrucomicrobiota bacterium]
MKTLEGKTALITGGTSGIGRASAITLAQAGAQVVVTGRRENEGLETVKLVQDVGGEALFVKSDVLQEDQIKDSVEETVSKFGRLDIALNNAGVEIAGPIPEVQEADYRRIFDINVWGVLASMKYQIPVMLENGGGSIINVSSVAGKVGIAGVSIYVASKHAVEGLTKVAALEYAKEGLRVNAIAPGLIDTDMADRFAGKEGEQREYMNSFHPIGRSGKVNEVSDAVLWLAGDTSSFVTGHSLSVDGGWTAQ